MLACCVGLLGWRRVVLVVDDVLGSLGPSWRGGQAAVGDGAHRRRCGVQGGSAELGSQRLDDQRVALGRVADGALSLGHRVGEGQQVVVGGALVVGHGGRADRHAHAVSVELASAVVSGASRLAVLALSLAPEAREGLRAPMLGAGFFWAGFETAAVAAGGGVTRISSLAGAKSTCCEHKRERRWLNWG